MINLFTNNHIERIIHNLNGKNEIRIILLIDFKLELKFFGKTYSNENLNFQYEEGLSKDLNKDSLISILMYKNCLKPFIAYFDFNKTNKLVVIFTYI